MSEFRKRECGGMAARTTETERFMTTQEVAEYLHVPRSTLDYWSYRQQGPRFTRIGSKRHYRRTDLDAWLKRQPTGGDAE
jgi:excisionase family DNA binding protein